VQGEVDFAKQKTEGLFFSQPNSPSVTCGDSSPCTGEPIDSNTEEEKMYFVFKKL